MSIRSIPPGTSPTVGFLTGRHRPGRLGQARLGTADQAIPTHGLTDCETILVGISPGVWLPTQLSPEKKTRGRVAKDNLTTTVALHHSRSNVCAIKDGVGFQ